MSTPFTEIISNYAMLYIDDSRLQEQVSISPAQFYRRMSLYMNAAVPMFDRPPSMQSYLNYELKKPTYASQIWVSTEDSTTKPTTIETGLIGYELFSSTSIEGDTSGVYMMPYGGATYDPETGFVVIEQQEKAGIKYSFDFYNDGIFFRDLTDAQKRILGLCVAQVWVERFTMNWQSLTPKIGSRSFTLVNESTYMKSTTEMRLKYRQMLSEELRHYEQGEAYKSSKI